MKHIKIKRKVILYLLMVLVDFFMLSYLLNWKIDIESITRSLVNKRKLNSQQFSSINEENNKKLDSLEKLNCYTEYYRILKERINQYGILPEHTYYDAMEKGLSSIIGVSHAKLIDFDGNGMMELFICYNNIQNSEATWTYEVWSYQEKLYLVVIDEVELFGGGSMIKSSMNLFLANGKAYLVIDKGRKEDLDGSVVWYHDYSYSIIKKAKWVTEKMDNVIEDYKGLPWKSGKCILSFDEFTFSLKEINSIEETIEELERLAYSRRKLS